jgi:hypothetical protein
MNGGGAASTGAGKGRVDNTKSAIGKERDRLVSELKNSFPNKFRLQIKDKDGKVRSVLVEVWGKDYKHLANDIMTKKVIQSSKTKKLSKQLKNSYCKKSADLFKERKDKIDKFYYMKVKGRKLYFNIARHKYTRKNGTIYYRYRIHAITRNCK